MDKPITRTSYRLYLGQIYYSFKRYIQWYFGNTKFAMTKEQNLRPFVASSHQSLLLRKLKDVDMWMQYNKITNLRLAISKLDGIVIRPGETFSFWHLVGTTTKRKGYQEGMVLTQGSFRAGVGGGLCQLSNLIYWMTLHTPLTITERHRHSYDVFPDSSRTQPFGSGATVSYNYIDLQIKNTTNQPYQLHLYIDEEYLNGEWRTSIEQIYRYEVYEKKHSITQEYWGGYMRHNEIYRKVYNNNHELIADEFITENNAMMMYQPFLGEAKSNNERSNFK